MWYHDIKKIDIHAHATPFPEISPNGIITGMPWISGEDLIKLYSKLNVEKGVLLPLTSPEGIDEQITTSGCKHIADRYANQFLWFCNIDPRASGNTPTANLSHLLKHYKSLGAKGVGEITANIPIDDPLMENLFHHCEECDMPVTIHLAPMNADYGFYGVKDDLGLPRLERILKKFPKLKVFAHSTLFWAEISADITEEARLGYPTGRVIDGRVAQLLRENPNLYCDLSAGSGMNALMRDKEYATKFIETFSDRIMYGCDIGTTLNSHPFVFEQWLNQMCEEGRISQGNYYKFVRGNAERLLKL